LTVDEKFHIVVEGGEDLLFMKGYLRFLEISFSDECFKSLGGWNKLDGYMPNIKEKRDKGVKVKMPGKEQSKIHPPRQERENLRLQRSPWGAKNKAPIRFQILELRPPRA